MFKIYPKLEEQTNGLYLNKGYKVKAQATIEFSLAFVIAVLFLLLTCRLFVWFNGNLLRRQLSYENSRTSAGTGGQDQTNFYKDQPTLDLFSQDIFKNSKKGD